MVTESQDRVYGLLERLPHDGLAAAKEPLVTVRFELSPVNFEGVLAAMVERTEMGDSFVAFAVNRQQEMLKELRDASHE